ncbi:MAG: hypothetical protein LBI04_11140 [Treponema sp.]|nr:hypothetical protein [Treponema sp.]
MKHTLGQLLLLVVLCTCTAKKEASVIPPVTSPFSRDYIGFGVVTESFTHITSDPSEDSPSIGYLRRGSLVRILRRQTIKVADVFTSWVLIEGDRHGWLKEDVMDIYDSENQAKTASESMSR